tara:strand:+ start:609 stop:1394 length:786 start_codon:yes stop_codon:yes gene_type:complete
MDNPTVVINISDQRKVTQYFGSVTDGVLIVEGNENSPINPEYLKIISTEVVEALCNQRIRQNKPETQASIDFNLTDLENRMSSRLDEEEAVYQSIKRSLEYWAVGNGRETIDRLRQDCHSGRKSEKELRVELSDHLAFDIYQIGIFYSPEVTFSESEPANNDLAFRLVDGEDELGRNFEVSEYEPATSTFGEGPMYVDKLMNLLFEEGLTGEDMYNKVADHIESMVKKRLSKLEKTKPNPQLGGGFSRLVEHFNPNRKNRD